jgi:hypothetical protein
MVINHRTGKNRRTFGPGWLVSRFTFIGTVTLTDGAVLEGDALFNNVTLTATCTTTIRIRVAGTPLLQGLPAQMGVITNLTLNGNIFFTETQEVNSQARYYLLRDR